MTTKKQNETTVRGSARAAVLFYLENTHSGEAPAQHVADYARAGLSLGQAVAALAALERDGLVRGKAHTWTTNRRKIYSLTAAGRAVVARLAFGSFDCDGVL